MAEQFILFFALLTTGYICKKMKIIDDGMNRSINGFIINVAYPCLILGRIGSLEMTDGIFGNFILALIFYTGLFIPYGLYAYGYSKLRKFPEEDRGVVEFAMISPNNGFMGFPIAITFFGEVGLLYMIACNLALNLMFFSYGIHLMTRSEKGSKTSVKALLLSVLKLIINPKIGSAVLGLIICENGIDLPEILAEYLNMVGGIATPLAMIFIGSTLTGSSLIKILKSRVILEITISKLFILPALTLCVVYFIPIDPLIKAILVLSSAMPCATTLPIFAQQYGKNESLASESLFLSTIVSLASIPLWIAVINQLM